MKGQRGVCGELSVHSDQLRTTPGQNKGVVTGLSTADWPNTVTQDGEQAGQADGLQEEARAGVQGLPGEMQSQAVVSDNRLTPIMCSMRGDHNIMKAE